ncbi:MAG: ribosomal protein L7/L12 [Actinomycetota bacterium]
MSSNAPRRHDEILGARVVLTGWTPKRRDEVSRAVREVTSQDIVLAAQDLPFVVLAKVSLEKAEAARALLTDAGASVELEDAWVTRDAQRAVAARPECPFCGSGRTQPYGHAGPAARKNMKCTTCGRTFRTASGPSTR